ncbi:MAG: DNA polymerase IV [Candidatus Omnitrophota bacterium]|jgi:nucleotidyltransferase/DNA polymerase involved in DNA repair
MMPIPQKERYIVHVDMDAFFAAIEQRDNPSLKGKPVVIGADPKHGFGRGVVSTASYEARKFGICSAMPISIAYNRCPSAAYLPVNMHKYVYASKQIYNIINTFTPNVEQISIDEAFLDITASLHLFGSALDTCKLIKEKIKKETKLTASIGLAPTKMAAKIASDINKPDGIFEVKQENLLNFLWPLPVEKISGLGEKSKLALNRTGIKTIGDLAKRDKQELVSIFGKNGEYFWYLARGIDESEVKQSEEIKSISNETTFEEDTLDEKLIKRELLNLSESVSGRLRQNKLKARTITLKIRLTGFHTYTRAITLSKSTNFVDEIYKTSNRIYSDFIASKDLNRKTKIRLIGIKTSNLIDSGIKDSLFDEGRDKKKENIHKAVDKIKEKFGDNSIGRARV